MRGKKLDIWWLANLHAADKLSIPDGIPIQTTTIQVATEGQPGYVYFYRWGATFKAGYTGNPYRRFRALFGTEPDSEIIRVWWRENAFRAEQNLLAFMRESFGNNDRRSEVFRKLSPLDVVDVLNFMELCNP